MPQQNQRAELHATIWGIANDLRGAIGGWDFKAYVLSSLFYRFISENTTAYFNRMLKAVGSDKSYADMSDNEAENARAQAIDEKGFFILPSQLFSNVAKSLDTNKEDTYKNLNERISTIFHEIEKSALGTPSEDDLKGLFTDFVVDSPQLGNTVLTRNKLLAKVFIRVAEMDLGEVDYDNNKIDAFGDTYEYLMKMYASEGGKSGGEQFTPQEVSEVLARLASYGNKNIRAVYDPACGSGSLLLKFAKIVPDRNSIKYFGQELVPTNYNLSRINMFLHNINFDKFDIQCGDTLLDPRHRHEEPFDAIVSNPPYSKKWDGDANPLLINDDRYSPAGILAPKSASDLAFTMHILKSLSESGTAAIVEFPGVLYRGGAEKKIRQYLVNNNFVDTVIQLPQNLFFGVSIATCIIVLRKSARPDNNILFVDASSQFVKNGNKNLLTPENQDAIVNAYAERKEVQYFTRLVSCQDVAANDYNLSVSSYVEQEDTREAIDILQVNADLETLCTEGNRLRNEINQLIKTL